MWSILNDEFGGRACTRGSSLRDTLMEDDSDNELSNMEDSSEDAVTTPQPPTKATPTTPTRQPTTVQLAMTIQTGMEATAASLAVRAMPSDTVQTLAQLLRQQHQETRQSQVLQLDLLRRLVAQQGATSGEPTHNDK